MEHTTSPNVNGTLETLELEPGYWRSSTTSREIKECYETDSCVGGTEEYCAVGYDGPCECECSEPLGSASVRCECMGWMRFGVESRSFRPVV